MQFVLLRAVKRIGYTRVAAGKVQNVCTISYNRLIFESVCNTAVGLPEVYSYTRAASQKS